MTAPASLALVVVPDAPAHQFAIGLTVAAQGPLTFRLPGWLRGSYLVRDFAKHVLDLKASRDGVPVAVTRLDKASFSVPAGHGPLRLDYRVHALDESVRKAWLDTRRGFFNFSSLAYLPVGHEQVEWAVTIEAPATPACAGWQVATALPAVEVDARGYGRYRAPHYEALIDSPVEMAAFRRIDFDAAGLAHTVTLSGPGACDEPRLAQDLARICAVQREFFGGEPAMPRYWFLTNLTAASYGGLEHRESTALVCARGDLPKPGDAWLAKEYRTFLGLCSHEYFHLWNVKRITPAAFAASDLAGPAYTGDLWHYEGVTSYYDDLFLLRAGVIEASAYLDLVAEAATRLERSPARLVHSLADASFETWIKYYQPDDNSPNASTNYYVKGALLALVLDLELRMRSATTLDAVMQALWTRYGRHDEPAPEGALARTAQELSGLDLGSFFERHLHGVGELPLAESLAAFGVLATRRAAVSDTDAGGRASGTAFTRTLGVKLKADGSVAHVLAGTPAQAAGLAAGDLLLSLDGLKVGAGNFSKRLESLALDVPVELLWFRGDELMRADVAPAAAARDTWTLVLEEAPAPEALARRVAWLGA